MKKISSTLMALAGLAATQAALAHTGHSHLSDAATEFVAGFEHPLAGMDHLLAILAVGMWSALVSTGARRLAAPALFMLTMSAGAGLAVLGIQGAAQAASLELVIALSVVVLGVMLLMGRGLPPLAGMALIAVAGLAHGWAHGAEMAGQSFAAYAAGFLLSTLVMHMVGLMAGHKLFQLRQGMARGMGWMLAAAGLWMSLAAV